MTRRVFLGLHPLDKSPMWANLTDTPAPKASTADVLVPKLAEAELTDTKGTITARICTFGVRDLQDDIVSPGAFGRTPQSVVCSAWNHGSYGDGHGALPVGVGIVRAEGEHGVFHGKLLLETQAGRDTYEVLKAMGGRCSWSWGFTITKHRFGSMGGSPVRYIDACVISEVSPVMNAASIGSGTIDLHSLDPAKLAEQRTQREQQRAPVESVVRAKRANRNDLAVELERARALGIRV